MKEHIEQHIQQRLVEFAGRETECWDFWGTIRIVKTIRTSAQRAVRGRRKSGRRYIPLFCYNEIGVDLLKGPLWVGYRRGKKNAVSVYDAGR